MKTYNVVTKKQEELDSLQCNRCGKICQDSTDPEPKSDYLEVEVYWGYYSKKDGEKHKWDICEECYDKIVSEFVLFFEKTNWW